MTNVASPPETQNFLSFSVNSQVAGLLPSLQLVEVLSVTTESIVPISGTAEAVMGVCNWRGEVLWLIDVGATLQAGRLCDHNLLLPQYNVIIAKSPQGPVGLVVETVGQMCWVDPNDVAPAPPLGQTPTASLPPLPYLQGYWQSPEQSEIFAILDLERLLQAL
ncbi:chemotaxis protein CheW [filamentous cyanobacterium LEGE 11480]|uniref:Chemotaxis protein CheW n=1 Tax=Romeriopsis navalis LEGE 11480 TaxID=2777977 RepID=A0A928VNJ3_9CYAN|nr:chemotaxis protein CheW [Romeriopsis navalis]MBE9029981.1 chemotaxis protein CheW [Romeriopsis navalis LEGE 11480]